MKYLKIVMTLLALALKILMIVESLISMERRRRKQEEKDQCADFWTSQF